MTCLPVNQGRRRQLVIAVGIGTLAPALIDAAQKPGKLWRIGYCVDRIAKGANPAAMPIEQPTAFERVLNMQTAETLNITLPPSVLVRAERVIQ